MYLGREKFFARDLQFIVPSRLSGGAMTVLTTSCHGGSFISPKWATFAAVPSQHLSLSFSRSKSLRHRGGVWVAAFSHTVCTNGGSSGDEFGTALGDRVVAVKPAHARPVHSVHLDDKACPAVVLLAAENTQHLPPGPLTRDTGDGDSTAGTLLDRQVAAYMESAYPNPDAPPNRELHQLLAFHCSGIITPSERRALAQELQRRQASDDRAT